MQAIQVNDAETKICDGGFRDFLHIQNNSDTMIYIAYDGDSNPVTAVRKSVTVAIGMPLAPGTTYTLENTGPRQLFTKPVYAIHGAAGQQKEVRVQGV